MSRLLLAALTALSVSALGLSGCYTLKFETKIEEPDRVQMTQYKNGRVAKRFSEGKLVWYLLGGLIPLGDADLTSMLKPHVADNRRVANLKVHNSTWFDIWLVSLTSISIEGDEVIPR